MQQQSITITCSHLNFGFTSLHFTSRLKCWKQKIGTLKHQTTPKINNTKYDTGQWRGKFQLISVFKKYSLGLKLWRFMTVDEYIEKTTFLIWCHKTTVHYIMNQIYFPKELNISQINSHYYWVWWQLDLNWKANWYCYWYWYWNSNCNLANIFFLSVISFVSFLMRSNHDIVTDARWWLARYVVVLLVVGKKIWNVLSY